MIYLYNIPSWLGVRDSNPRMTGPKPVALPLGQPPMVAHNRVILAHFDGFNNGFLVVREMFGEPGRLAQASVAAELHQRDHYKHCSQHEHAQADMLHNFALRPAGVGAQQQVFAGTHLEHHGL